MIAGMRPVFAGPGEARSAETSRLAPQALAQHDGHGVGPARGERRRGEQSVGLGIAPRPRVVPGPAVALGHARREIDGEIAGQRFQRARPPRVCAGRLVEIAEHQPERPPWPGKAAFDQPADRLGLQPADGPGGFGIRGGRLEMAVEEREAAHPRHQAVAAKDRKTLGDPRRVGEPEVGGREGGMARDVLQQMPAQERDIEAAAVVAGQADAVRPGRSARPGQEAVVEVIEGGAVEDLLQGDDIRIEIAQHRGGHAPVDAVEPRRRGTAVLGFVGIAGAVEPRRAVPAPQPEVLQVEGRDAHCRGPLPEGPRRPV